MSGSDVAEFADGFAVEPHFNKRAFRAVLQDANLPVQTDQQKTDTSRRHLLEQKIKMVPFDPVTPSNTDCVRVVGIVRLGNELHRRAAKPRSLYSMRARLRLEPKSRDDNQHRFASPYFANLPVQVRHR